MPIIGDFKSRRRVPGKIIIPSSTETYVKIQIIDDDSVTHTVLDTYGGGENDNHTITPPTLNISATDKLGNFKLRIANDGGRFLNKFNGGEIVKIYADKTDATTLRFYGRINDDGVKYGLGKEFYIDINGRDYPELVDKTITGIQAAASGDEAICSIFNEFYTDIKLKFWNGSSWSTATYDSEAGTVSWSPSASNFPTKLINTSYQHKKGLTIISEILKKIGCDSYLEYNEGETQWYLKTFVSEDINSNLAIAFGVNLVSAGEIGTSEVFNKITAYGKKESESI